MATFPPVIAVPTGVAVENFVDGFRGELLAAGVACTAGEDDGWLGGHIFFVLLFRSREHDTGK